MVRAEGLSCSRSLFDDRSWTLPAAGARQNTDRVSRDGELWEPVTQVPELIPEELLNLQSDDGWNAFLKVRDSKDERRSTTIVTQERRTFPDPVPEQLRDEWQAPPPPMSQSVLPWSLLGITLAALGVVLYLNASAGIAG